MSKGRVIDPTDRRPPYKKPPESKMPTLTTTQTYVASWSGSSGSLLEISGGGDHRTDGWEIGDLIIPGDAFDPPTVRLNVGRTTTTYGGGSTYVVLREPYVGGIMGSFQIERRSRTKLLFAYYGSMDASRRIIVLDSSFGDLSDEDWSSRKMLIGFGRDVNGVACGAVSALAAPNNVTYNFGNTRLRYSGVLEPVSLGYVTVVGVGYSEEFDLEEPTFWLCEVCGFPWRKWDLTRREITNKLVCPNCNDGLSHEELKQDNYQGEAMARAAERLSVLSEIP